MNNELVLERLRRFLLATAGLLLIGTLFELFAIQHWNESVQLLPFVLSFVGLAGVAWAWFRPERQQLLAVRWLMVPLALGSLVGVFFHIQNNVGRFLDRNPDAGLLAIIGGALSGDTPLVAPGMLALAGILAAAATYYHPALAARQVSTRAVEA